MSKAVPQLETLSTEPAICLGYRPSTVHWQTSYEHILVDSPFRLQVPLSYPEIPEVDRGAPLEYRERGVGWGGSAGKIVAFLLPFDIFAWWHGIYECY